MGRLARSLAFALLALAVSPGPGEARETLRVAGSTTLAPVVAAWSADLAHSSPPLALEVSAGGSATGPYALLTGAADVASLSRPMDTDELDAFQERFGARPLAVAVAADAIAIFVHPDNPIEGLSVQQVDAIFAERPGCSEHPPARTWGDVGLSGQWADRTISVFGRDPSSGTRVVFERLALCGARFSRALRERPGPESTLLSVAESRFSVAYGSRSDAVESVGGAVRIVPISDGRGGSFETPGVEAVRDGRYPLGRHLQLVAVVGARGLDPRVARLMRFALSDAGQAAVEAAGFWALSAERRAEEIDALGRAAAAPAPGDPGAPQVAP